MGQGHHPFIQECSCAPCGQGRKKFWICLAIIGGLYLLGKRQHPDERQASVEAIDDPEATETSVRFSRLPQFRLMREYIMRHALAGRRMVRVLDIGSGAGQLALMLAKQPEVKETVGIDLSNDLVKLARQSAEERGVNIEFLQVDAAEMPFPDASFDVVVSTVSLHQWEDPQKVFQKIKRVLAPDGLALIFDLRRDAPTVFWGVATLITRYLAPRVIGSSREPLASLKASYTTWEAALLACKAGWDNPKISKGPIWMVMELEK